MNRPVRVAADLVAITASEERFGDDRAGDQVKLRRDLRARSPALRGTARATGLVAVGSQPGGSGARRRPAAQALVPTPRSGISPGSSSTGPIALPAHSPASCRSTSASRSGAARPPYRGAAVRPARPGARLPRGAIANRRSVARGGGGRATPGSPRIRRAPRSRSIRYDRIGAVARDGTGSGLAGIPRRQRTQRPGAGRRRLSGAAVRSERRMSDPARSSATAIAVARHWYRIRPDA